MVEVCPYTLKFIVTTYKVIATAHDCFSLILGGIVRVCGLALTPRIILMTDGEPSDDAGSVEVNTTKHKSIRVGQRAQDTLLSETQTNSLPPIINDTSHKSLITLQCAYTHSKNQLCLSVCNL